MMKATFILSVLFALQVHAGVYSQQVRMSMELERASIKQIINEIKLHTEFSFVMPICLEFKTGMFCLKMPRSRVF